MSRGFWADIVLTARMESQLAYSYLDVESAALDRNNGGRSRNLPQCGSLPISISPCRAFEEGRQAASFKGRR